MYTFIIYIFINSISFILNVATSEIIFIHSFLIVLTHDPGSLSCVLC